jgi:hypothetical protein
MARLRPPKRRRSSSSAAAPRIHSQALLSCRPCRPDPDEVLDADYRKAQAVRFAGIWIDTRGSGGHHIRHLGVDVHQSIRRKYVVLVGVNRLAGADDRIPITGSLIGGRVLPECMAGAREVLGIG